MAIPAFSAILDSDRFLNPSLEARGRIDESISFFCHINLLFEILRPIVRVVNRCNLNKRLWGEGIIPLPIAKKGRPAMTGKA